MYKIYFYSEPVFLYIDSESIIDLDLKVIGKKKLFEMINNNNSGGGDIVVMINEVEIARAVRRQKQQGFAI